MYLFVEGQSTPNPSAEPPECEQYYTADHEIHLMSGQQYTISPDTRHWFKAGEDGAVISEFSSRSIDEKDVFTDPAIDRMANIEH